MQRFNNMLVVVGGEPDDAALRRGVELALQNQAALTLIDVVAPVRGGWLAAVTEPSAEALQAELVQQRREELLRLAAEYVATGTEPNVVVRVGKPAAEIVAEAIRGKHDLVLKVANTQRGIRHRLGSVTRSLMRICPCPVWAVQPGSTARYQNILAAIDPLADDPQHEQLNQQIAELSVAMARRESARLQLVSVWSVPMEHTLRSRLGVEACQRLIDAAEARVRRTVQRWQHDHLPNDLAVEVHLLRGAASATIAEVAERFDIDLIVMGTVCRGGLSALLVGNTAEHLLASVTCGVLALKPPGFISPVQADS